MKRFIRFMALVPLASAAGLSPCAAGAGTVVGLAAPADTTVLLRGCVVDASYVPHAGAVVLRAQDGRLIGRALTDADGFFTARVPPRQRIGLTLDEPDGDGMTAIVGTREIALDACLRADTR